MKINIFMTIVGVCLTGLLYGCVPAEQPEEITLYVESYYPSDFMQNFGIPFELQNEHIRVEVVKREIREPTNEFVDLVLVDRYEEYEEKIRNGEIILLDPFILKHSSLLTDLSYARNKAIDILKEYSDQQLYALPLGLTGYGLFYNVDLFDEYDVPYPTDFISWEEVFSLASQFPLETDQGERVYGLAHSYAYDTAAISYPTEIGSHSNIYIVDDEWNMTMNTPEWTKIWNMAIPAMKAGHIDISENDFDDGIPFEEGSAAMIYSDPGVTNNIMKKNEEERFQWNVVAGPVIPKYSFTNVYYLTWDAYGISEQSSHKEEAWELLRFIFEKDLYSSSHIDGVSMEPFYAVDYKKPNF